MIRVTFPVSRAMDEGFRAIMTESPLMNSLDACMTSAMTGMAVRRGSHGLLRQDAETGRNAPIPST